MMLCLVIGVVHLNKSCMHLIWHLTQVEVQVEVRLVVKNITNGSHAKNEANIKCVIICYF